MRHAHTVALEPRVGRDDAARRKVDTLSHEVAAYAPLLALEALVDALAVRTAAVAPHPRGFRNSRIVVDEHEDLVLQTVEAFQEFGRHGGERLPRVLSEKVGNVV